MLCQQLPALHEWMYVSVFTCMGSEYSIGFPVSMKTLLFETMV